MSIDDNDPNLPPEWGSVLSRTDAQDLADYKQAAEVLRGIVKEKAAEIERLRAALTNIAEVEGDTMVGRRALRALNQQSVVGK